MLILLFTGEWSQRGVCAAFTQEPRRIRVVNAKLAVSLLMGGGAAVFGGVVTAAGLGLTSASDRVLDANLTPGAVTGYLLFVLLNVFAGVALGALLQSSAITIADAAPCPPRSPCSTQHRSWSLTRSTWSTTFNWVLENDWGIPRPPDLGLGPLLGGGPAGRRISRPCVATSRSWLDRGPPDGDVSGGLGVMAGIVKGLSCSRPPQGAQVEVIGTCPRSSAGRKQQQPGQSWQGWCSRRHRRVVALRRRDERQGEDRVFEVGSITKTFAAAGALGDWSIGCAADRTFPLGQFPIMHGCSSQAV